MSRPRAAGMDQSAFDRQRLQERQNLSDWVFLAADHEAGAVPRAAGAAGRTEVDEIQTLLFQPLMAARQAIFFRRRHNAERRIINMRRQNGGLPCAAKRFQGRPPHLCRHAFSVNDCRRIIGEQAAYVSLRLTRISRR